ncbi:MAG: PAS domain-containing protein, partial [Rugosibacter sp.]|nr:PAS domain-containing protein [Rugosibacter sp.]
MNSLPDQILDNSAFFKQIYNEARDPILLVDAETWQLIDGNQACQELLGISEKTKLQTLALLDITPAEQPNGRNSAALLADIETQAKTADYLRFECVHQRLDGGTFEVEVTATLITINDQQIAHVHWRDIGEKKQIQKQLTSTADSFRRVFEDASSPIILISLHGRILEANQAAVAIFRYPDKGSLVGKTPLEMALQNQPDGQNSVEMGHELIKLVLQQGTQHFEWQMQCLDGTVISTEITLTLINNYNVHNNQIIHAHIRDLTEQKRLEADLLAEKERAE